MPYRLLRGRAVHVSADRAPPGKGETRGRVARGGTVTQIPRNKTCCIRRIAARQVTDPATFSALLIAMRVDERVQVAAHAPRECA